MKHNKIFSSEVVHKGKTLDKVLESSGGGKESGTPNYIAMLWDNDNPPFSLGEDPIVVIIASQSVGGIA